MNLHEIQAMQKPGFLVHASNIHTDEARTYGPFPGTPMFTYEFMRCTGEDNVPDDDHIFRYCDPPDPLTELEDHWTDQEDEMRWDGWRRCYGLDGQFGIARGPYWTDLYVEFIPNVTDAWESNQLPEDPPP